MDFKTLQNAMIAAMKARDKERKESISVLVSAAKKAAIDAGCREDIPDEIVDAAILKEIKSVKEQVETCPAERTDLKEAYENRYAVMSEFAPKMMDKDEIKEILLSKYKEVVETKNRGQIMKAAMPEFKGKADGKLVQQVVGELIG
ncbi:MAG: GatB/YqeY domain-containing protein [Lachnospiraceae bacterium]|nr:GatB/YqeY domain-containing protein [Lachnospiraceae bacterium]